MKIGPLDRDFQNSNIDGYGTGIQCGTGL